MVTATATHPPAADLRTGDGPWPRRVFVAGLVVAAPLLLWVGRDHWFFLDEWLVLQRDGLTDPGYLDAHNGHWITVVALDYRLNFRLWGLGTYLPYQVPVVAAHLASAALLRIVMLRVGVRGWLATGAALVFVFLGSGRDNITFGFQISMTGSLLAGLALLLIADHAGPVDRRDLVGLLVGVVGLMTSSVFVALLVGVGVAVLVRRGPRVAAFYAVPLGIVYGAWYLRYGAGEGDPLRLTGNTVRFAARMFGAVFSALTAGGVAGAVLVAVAAVGIVASVQAARRTGEWHAAALLLGLLAGWLVFAGLTALGRAEVGGDGRQPRRLALRARRGGAVPAGGGGGRRAPHPLAHRRGGAGRPPPGRGRAAQPRPAGRHRPAVRFGHRPVRGGQRADHRGDGALDRHR